MKLSVDRKIGIGYLTSLILLIVSYLLLFTTTDRILKQTKIADQSKENILKLEIFVSSLKDVENNYYSYLLTANHQFFINFKNKKATIDSSILTIDGLVQDSAKFKQIEELKAWLNQVSETFDKGINEFSNAKQVFTGPVKNITNKVSLIMDSIKIQIDSMLVIERQLIHKGDPAAEEYFIGLKIINFTSLTIAIFIALFSIISYYKGSIARHMADEQAFNYRAQLEQKIAELNRSNRELKELKSIEKFAATGRMARMIAHEVRNPLTNIGLANDQLKDAVEQNDENLMLMNMIKRNGERINQMVGDLLNATKFVELNLSKFSINELLDEVLLFAKDRILLSNTKITKHYSDNLCNVLVDTDKIKIAFLNVIINSIEASNNGKGEIQIITSNSKSMCKVVIRDNGEGMNKEIISKIFEPFFTSRDKGYGLGLTNTQNIILNHKGFITVKSELGKGTDFIFKLNFA